MELDCQTGCAGRRAQRQRPAGPRVAALLVLVLMLAGCTTGPSPDSPPGETDIPTASIHVAWAPERSDLVLGLDRPAPDDLVVRVQTQTGGSVQVASQELVALSNTTYRVADPVALAAGQTYRIQVHAGSELVAERNITVVEAAIGEPVGLDLRATYEAQQSQVRETENGLSVTNGRGNATLEVQREAHRFRFDGAGTMHLVQDELDLRLDLHTFVTEDTNDETSALHLAGNGTWRMDDPPTTAHGRVVTFDSRFEGREDKQVARGEHVPSERMHRIMVLEGTVEAQRENGTLSIWQQETSWLGLQTGQRLWVQGNETRRFTFANDTQWRNDTWNRSVEPADQGPRLSELVDVEGLRPAALRPGDTVTLAGTQDVRIRYTVNPGGNLETAAGRIDVLHVEGRTLGAVNGTERWVLVDGGSLAGLPVSVDLDHGFQGQAFRMRMGLVEVLTP